MFPRRLTSQRPHRSIANVRGIWLAFSCLPSSSVCVGSVHTNPHRSKKAMKHLVSRRERRATRSQPTETRSTQASTASIDDRAESARAARRDHAGSTSQPRSRITLPENASCLRPVRTSDTERSLARDQQAPPRSNRLSTRSIDDRAEGVRNSQRSHTSSTLRHRPRVTLPENAPRFRTPATTPARLREKLAPSSDMARRVASPREDMTPILSAPKARYTVGVQLEFDFGSIAKPVSRAPLLHTSHRRKGRK